MNIFDQGYFLISLFGMTGTVGAAIAALLSADIAKKSLQRQEEHFNKSLEPLIVPKAMTYARKVNFDNVNFIYNNWNETKSGNFNLRYEDVEIPLLNLSNGIAKDIKIKSEVIKYDELIKVIQNTKLKSFDILDIKFIDEYNKKGFLINAQNKISGLYEDHPIELFSEQEILYLTNKGDNLSVKIPKSFVVFQNLYIYLSYIEKTPNLMAPMLVFTIDYKDIAGNSYTAKYTMKVNKITIKKEKNSRQMHEERQIISFTIEEYKIN
ncbi:hypothetical protein SPD48_15425 [Pseudogracilibacillus sp. SE30717A]|uniref:hypothetical protein n=1 Tax=Pseudogracilibacillus sp. SE30717A TaxID=3098293 RepID=UPI00300E2884